MKRHREEAARCAIAKSNELLESARAKTDELLAHAGVRTPSAALVKDDEHAAVLEVLVSKTFFTEDHDVSIEHVREAKPCSRECWMQQHSGDEKGFLQDVNFVCPAGRALFLLCSKLAGLSRVDSAAAYE